MKAIRKNIIEDQIKETTDIPTRVHLCALLAHLNGHDTLTISSVLGVSENDVKAWVSEFEKEFQVDPNNSCSCSNHKPHN
jgi:hypothetical protein